MSIPLGSVSLAGASISGVATVLTKKYQRKLAKVTKLTDMVTSALAVFEARVSKVLNDGRVDEQEFNMIQALHFGSLNDLSNVDCKMEVEIRSQLQKSQQEEINDLKKELRKRDAS